MRTAALALFLAAPLLLADEKIEPKDPKVKPREITVKGLPTERGRFGKPEKMETEADMKKVVLDESAQKEISKQVNFKNELLLLFRWSGSGQDQLTFTTDKNGDVTFNLKRGLTRDLRMHSKLFAIPKGAKYKLPGAK